jgi:hypothetical protein
LAFPCAPAPGSFSRPRISYPPGEDLLEPAGVVQLLEVGDERKRVPGAGYGAPGVPATADAVPAVGGLELLLAALGAPPESPPAQDLARRAEVEGAHVDDGLLDGLLLHLAYGGLLLPLLGFAHGLG